MRRFLTLVCLLCLAIPAGISISGCTRNPDANYCNGLGYGLKVTDLQSIVLQPQTTGISIAFGQTQQASSPVATACHGATVAVPSYTYGTTNNQLVDISPSGNICAGTWNRNTGGGIANYTICNKPNPLPSTNGLPYGTAYITASAQSVSSNPVEVYVHPQVTSVTLALSGQQQCYSQGTETQLDAQACFLGSNNQQQLLCAPPSVTSANYACPALAGTTISDCSAALGTLNYLVGTSNVASINNETNQITAEQPGTTVITASVALSGSSAGYFSTCPPKSINVTLANGAVKGTITQGVSQNLVTTILDTNNLPITGLSLDYQSTDPADIGVGSGGSISTNFPGVASIYAICQPSSCNPSQINEIGLSGTGLSISSNPVTVTVPGTASDYVWFSAPGQSQYFVPVELLTGTISPPVRLPYVPNSMVMDKGGNDLYFGSSRELMIYSALNNSLAKQDTNAPGVVLAVSPDNTTLLINDQVRQVFYIYNTTNGINSTNGGMGNAAAWTPDSKTLYITDSAALNNTPENVAAGITGHTDTMYVYNQNTGWTSYALPCSVAGPHCASPSTGALSLAITIPSVGAFLSGSPTTAHTWCPSGTVGDSASILFYPQGPPPDNSVAVQTDVLAATTDGNHILGASTSGNSITLSDIGVSIPAYNCLPEAADTTPGAVNTLLAPGGTLSPLVLGTTLTEAQVTAIAAQVNQVVPSPASNLAFITYTGSTPGASLPYYMPGSGGAAGTQGYVTLSESGCPTTNPASSCITAPVAGAFSPDNKLFFVSTAGDNMIHYISIPANLSPTTPPTDTQEIAPNLPACTPVADGGVDPGCTLAAPTTNPVPATIITVKPRSTT
jgi:trimeric autotransporter adhesin